MPFNSSGEADRRLVVDSAKLTQQEVRDLMVWMRQLSAPGIQRLNVELSLQSLEAIQRFERSSSRLTGWLIGLTGVLVALTIVIVYYTFVLARIAHQVK